MRKAAGSNHWADHQYELQHANFFVFVLYFVATMLLTFEPVGAAFFRHMDDVKRGRMVSLTDVNHSYEAAMHEEPVKPEPTATGDDDYVDIGSGEWKVCCPHGSTHDFNWARSVSS